MFIAWQSDALFQKWIYSQELFPKNQSGRSFWPILVLGDGTCRRGRTTTVLCVCMRAHESQDHTVKHSLHDTCHLFPRWTVKLFTLVNKGFTADIPCRVFTSWSFSLWSSSIPLQIISSQFRLARLLRNRVRGSLGSSLWWMDGDLFVAWCNIPR